MVLHRVFDSPRDPIVFDTGHQAYVHKIVTGRADRFDTLRTRNGLSGYPSRAESEHDWVENSHASTSLSYADGLAKAFQVRGEQGRTPVAVIGDGALTGGMAWEALNNIASAKDRPLVIVLNDNGRSYAPDHRRDGREDGRACGPGPATSGRWARSSAGCRRRRWSAGRCTRRCTRSSGPPRTCSCRRACSRTWA